MTITFRSSSTDASSGTVNVPTPAGVVAGDVLVAFVQASSVNNPTPTPVGWTLVRSTQVGDPAGSGLGELRCYVRVATASEPASTSWSSAPAANNYVAAILAYSGVDTASPITVSGGVSGTVPSVTAPSIFADKTGVSLVALAAQVFTAPSAPSGTTSRASRVQPNIGGLLPVALSVSDFAVSAGATPEKSSTLASSSNAAGQQVALREANSAPNAPTLTATTATLNKDAGNRFSWTPSDPNVGDSQSAYDLRYRLAGATSWTTVSGSTPNAYRDMAAGTFVAGDYEWQVRTYDAGGLVAPWSASSFFTAASAPAGPAITDPINGQTISGSSYLLQWSSSDQQEFEASVLDADGAVVFTSGTVAVAAQRSLPLEFPVNSASRTIRLRTRTAGLWSPYASVTVLISYTTPAVAGASVLPVSTISGSTGTDAILVELLNPVPSGGQPAVGSHRIYRRAGGTGDGVRIVVDHPAGQAYVDRTPASGVDYSYRVESIAANGTASTTEWVSDAVGLTPGAPGAPGDEGYYADDYFDVAYFD